MKPFFICTLALFAYSTSAQDYMEEDDFQRLLVNQLSGEINLDVVETECEPDAHAPKPNIIFFLADDFGFGDISWNNPDVETPNLQELADKGIILDRNYVMPACSPSRGSLYTGKYAHRVGMQHSVIVSEAPEGLGTEHKMISEYLKEADYSNHFLGKWHLGYCDEKYLPHNRGFDSFYGFYNSHIDHFEHTIDGMYDFWDNGQPDIASNGSYVQTLLDDRAEEIISSHDPSTPLFLMMSSPLTHTPLQVAPGEESRTSYRDTFKTMIKTMDESAGKLINLFKQHGLYEDSVFIFSADNGGMSNAYFSDVGNLRGAKNSIYEGGTRVPAMFHSPKQREEVRGTVHTGTFHITDWLPTLLSFAGVCAPGVDGVNQRKMLLSGEESARSEVVYNVDQYEPYTFGNSAIRMGDYKLIVGYPGKYDGWATDRNIGYTYVVDHMGINGDDDNSSSRKKRSWASVNAEDLLDYARRAVGHVQLYNVMTDPEERNNLADSMPSTVEVMKARIQEHFQQAVELDLNKMEPSEEARDPSYNGIWSPGWC